MRSLGFWFEFASTYSYPAAMRIEAACVAAGVALEWKPFLLGPVFAAQGMTDSPFNLYPIKGRYMWRDMERLCAAQGLGWQKPGQFPRGSLLAARVASAHAQAPWVAAFVRAVYVANFAQDRDIGRTRTVTDILQEIGVDPAPVLDRAQSPEGKQSLRNLTDSAQAHGLFGAPSFTVGDELFWGGDRLDAAIAAATGCI